MMREGTAAWATAHARYMEPPDEDEGLQRTIEKVGEHETWFYLCDTDQCGELFAAWLETQMETGWIWEDSETWPNHLRPLLNAFRADMSNSEKHVEAAREAAAVRYQEEVADCDYC